MLRATATAFAALLAVAPCGVQAGPRGQRPGAGARSLGAAFDALAAGDFRRAEVAARRAARTSRYNRDYATFAAAQAAYLRGDAAAALRRFHALARDRSSRFAAIAAWRHADCLWRLGRTAEARREYERLLRRERRRKRPTADLAVARFRVAEALARAGDRRRAIDGFAAVLRLHPQHPIADRADARLRELAGARPLASDERIARARALAEAHLWRRAVHELDQIGDDVPEDVRYRRDLELGRTLFQMRRQYELAGRLLLAVAPHAGDDSDWAWFHGARALSRAHRDREAIAEYERFVAARPRSRWAAEAAYLAGWLRFNLGDYREAIEPLRRMQRAYPRSRWAEQALWFEAFARYLSGDWQGALPLFERLGRRDGRLDGGAGRYWHARTLQRLGRADDALAEYRALVGQWPFSWYALLARARVREAGGDIGPFGDSPRSPDDAPPLADPVPAEVARDPRVRRADELIAAGLGPEAAYELRRVERALIRGYGSERALAALFDRYRAAGDYNRPWMLAVVRGRRALDAPPAGPARRWWEAAYPRAYAELVDRYAPEAGLPPAYLFAIMRKESGFNPHIVSYADAIGLLQMIPPTTRRVARTLGIDYTDDLLFDPESNVRLGAWYIGRLFAMFKRQVPIAAAAYNGGPGAVKRWLRAHGDRPIDEYVELVSYSQARGYGKKVTETYARYLYLYEGQVYDQPLAVDADYLRDGPDY